MKKLIALLGLIACTHPLFANFNELKVGDTFEYRIEDYRFEHSKGYKTIIDKDNSKKRRTILFTTEKWLDATLHFRLLKADKNGEKTFEVTPTTNYYQREKNSDDNKWETLEYYYRTIDEPNTYFKSYFPLL